MKEREMHEQTRDPDIVFSGSCSVDQEQFKEGTLKIMFSNSSTKNLN